MSFGKFTTKRAIEGISILVLLGIFSYCLFEFSSVIYYFRFGDLLDNYNLKNLFQDIVFVHSGLITSGFILILYSLFKKKIVLAEFALITLIGFFGGIYYLIDTHIHNFFLNLGIYRFLMREGQSVLNPQYTRIFLYLLAIFTLFIMILIRKKDRFQRIFIFLIGSSILSTTIIFHFAVPMGYFKFVRNNALYEMGVDIKDKSIKDICLDKDCIVFNKNWDVLYKDEDISEDFLGFYGNQLSSIKDIFNKSDEVYYSNFLSNFRGNTFDYVPIVFIEKDKNYVLITDENLTTGYSRISELVFVSITIVAHLFWYFLGFALYILHSNKKVYRLSV